MDNSYQDNSFEKFPGDSGEVSGEQLEKAAEWEQAMNEGVPEFSGDKFGIANPENAYYGETPGVTAETESGEEFNEGVSEASKILNYGLNGAVKEYGVEAVIQGINSFDATDSSNPIGDLFEHIGVDSNEERKDVYQANRASTNEISEFRNSPNRPAQDKSIEGALAAIEDMKELIAEVESADPRYEELRQGAKAAGKGYFEYAISDLGVQSLPELFSVLAKQREKAEEEEKMVVREAEEAKQEDADQSDEEVLNPEIYQA